MRIRVIFYSEETLRISFNYNLGIHDELLRCLQEYYVNENDDSSGFYKEKDSDFTFSHLMFPHRSIDKGHIVADAGYFSLYISSVKKSFIKAMNRALSRCNEFELQSQLVTVSNVNTIKEPEFTDNMRFRMMSPSLFAVRRGKKAIFLKPGDKAFKEVFESKLKEAWSRIYGKQHEGSVEIELDMEYLKKGNVTKLLKIDGVNYRAILTPFSLKGDVELIKFAYRNGIGDKNRFGLGMIDII